MTQEERLDFLVEAFKEDSLQYKGMRVNKDERRKVLRSLMNIRMPKEMDAYVLKVQDEFLQEEMREKGIVSLREIPTLEQQLKSKISHADKLSIWQGDITRLSVDAIVNAANSQLLGCFIPCHRCIDNAIHSAAGIELREECHQLMMRERQKYGRSFEEKTGEARITKAYNLPCKAVLHTVGPIVEDKLTDSLRTDLRNCYRSCLECLVENGYRSIAFCCISTGEFHFPNEEAAQIAVETVSEFLNAHEEKVDRVIFNVFKDLDREIYETLLKKDL